jgi:hypothetical protein
MARTLLTVAVAIGISFSTNAKPPAAWLSGGDGSSLEKAIVVHAPNESAGVDAEHAYIAKHFGYSKSIKVNIELYQHKTRGVFDIFRFVGRDGKKHTVYFDVNSYIGRF